MLEFADVPESVERGSSKGHRNSEDETELAAMIDPEKVILGAAQLGLNYGIANLQGQPSVEKAREILRSAAANGIKKVDTAVAYGSSQKVLGEIHENRFEFISKWGEDSAELSSTLALLKTEKLDIWMAHRSQALLNNPQLWRIMCDQKAKGLVNSIGVSVYRPSEVHALLDMGIVPDVIQLPMNVLSKATSDAISKFKELGIMIHARSIFLQGLLLCNPQSLDSFFDPIKPWLFALSERFPTKKSRVQALIRAVMKEAAVDFVVLGAESDEQIDDWFCATGSTSEQIPAIPDSLPQQLLNPTLWPK